MPSTILDNALCSDWTGWTGLGLLSLIFLANALGIIDPRTAIRELASTGLPESLARAAVLGGRVFQLLAVPAWFFSATRVLAALGLAAFLVPATLIAHAFWNAAPEKRDMQLAGFLKNVAIIGGLIIAAGWRYPA